MSLETQASVISHREMDRLIAAHLAAEHRADTDAAVAVYTDDVEHDVVGLPDGLVHGPEQARRFYEQLYQDIRTEEMVRTHAYYGDDHCMVEHRWTGTVAGLLFGIPGGGKRISFRVLHIFQFRDGKICRENVWVDSAAAIEQLSR